MECKTIYDRLPIKELETRITNLEERIKGGIIDVHRQQSLIQSLVETNERIVSLTAGRQDFNRIYAKMSSIEPLLTRVDPDHDPSIDREIIILQEPKIRHEAALLMQLKERTQVLDKNHLNDFGHLLPKIEELRVKSLHQLKETREINGQTQELISIYNSMVTTMKDIILEWDNRLKKRQQDRKE
jgi:hypothetical protein